MAAELLDQCVRCRHPWPEGDETPTQCPRCGHPVEEPPRYRFSLTGVLILGALCLVLVVVVATARTRRAGAAPSAESTESASETPVEPGGRARVGGVPCGYCNGDGRLDESDLNKRDPPRINAPPGPCPACVGRGGIKK